jgi:hypothetical protein
MSRAPTSGIAGQLSAVVTQSGYLVSIGVIGAATQYLCSLDRSFTFGGFSWQSNSIDISGINWQAGGVQSGQMVLGDVNLAFWAYALNLVLQNAPVSIWACYAGAPGEAEPLWSGRIGSIKRGNLELICGLVPDSAARMVPTRRIQSIIPSQFLAAPGTIFNFGSTQWTLDRQSFTA